jgi:hypothetical protein
LDSGSGANSKNEGTEIGRDEITESLVLYAEWFVLYPRRTRESLKNFIRTTQSVKE